MAVVFWMAELHYAMLRYAPPLSKSRSLELFVKGKRLKRVGHRERADLATMGRRCVLSSWLPFLIAHMSVEERQRAFFAGKERALLAARDRGGARARRRRGEY